jgi:hypothetical protein
MVRIRWVVLALVGAIAVALAACGGGNGDARTEEGLRKAAETAARALHKGDFKAYYNTFAKECRDQVSLEEFEAHGRAGFALVEAIHGVKVKDIEVESVEIRNFTPDAAEVAIKLRSPKGAEMFSDPGDFENWKWEDGRWVAANCSRLNPALAPGDGTSDSGGAGPRHGEAVTLGSGPRLGEAVKVGAATVTVNAVEDPAKSERRIPAEGSRFVAFDVTIEATTEPVWVSLFSFGADSKDAGFGATVLGRQPELPWQEQELAQGRKIRGWVTFEVPHDQRIVALFANFSRGPIRFSFDYTLVADLTR